MTQEAAVLLRGELERLRFVSDDGSFMVGELRCELGGEPARVLIAGNLGAARPGEHLEVEGRWRVDRRHGRQVRVERVSVVAPVTADGIARYLGGGLVDGVGPVLARRLVDAFGVETLRVLTEQPERVLEVDGIGKVRAQRIVEAWQAHHGQQQVMAFLHSHALSSTFSKRILDHWGPQAVEKILEDPYQLAYAIRGIGFLKADAVARAMGIGLGDSRRVKAGALYVLEEAHTDGHMFLPLDALRERSAELLQLPGDNMGGALAELMREGHIVIEPPEVDEPGGQPRIWRKEAHRAEVEAARHIRRLNAARGAGKPVPTEAEIARQEQLMGVTLADAQRRAVREVWQHPVMVLTGGPGTGKTTIIRVLVGAARERGLRVALAAPTGRAARRLAEATGQEAWTLHKLLVYQPGFGGFGKGEEEPLEADVVVVDEASMVDTYLLSALVAAVPDGARVVFVGDADQLPSVGPGDVLASMVACGEIAVARLGEVFRQQEASWIVRAAHLVLHGELPVAPLVAKGELADFYWIKVEEPERAQERILELVTGRIPSAFGLDPLRDVQVLSPMRRGAVGCDALNGLLQERLTAGAAELVRGKHRYRVGDRVIQTRNDYAQEVYNGDVGLIEALMPAERKVYVRYDERVIGYAADDLDDLRLAYALTIHKSQGSEYPAVVIPMLTQHFMMLRRQLLYTALTRARRLVVLVGSERAVGLAVREAGVEPRWTRLAWRLMVAP
jgi:exodeoxyribonuclease V alpha subunit